MSVHDGGHDVHLLMVLLLHLKTDDISILNPTLCKRELLLHKLDHSRFDFLVGPIRFPISPQ